jgi:hypothetical protein
MSPSQSAAFVIIGGDRQTYSPPIIHAAPLSNNVCYAAGLNELGDMTVQCWGDTGNFAARWSIKNPAFSQVISSRGDYWAEATGVNSSRVAVMIYSDANCGSCEKRVQLH